MGPHRSCAVVTMARDEKVLFPLFLRYYARHFASHEIFVLDHLTGDSSLDAGYLLAEFPRLPVPAEALDGRPFVRIDLRAAFSVEENQGQGQGQSLAQGECQGLCEEQGQGLVPGHGQCNLHGQEMQGQDKGRDGQCERPACIRDANGSPIKFNGHFMPVLWRSLVAQLAVKKLLGAGGFEAILWVDVDEIVCIDPGGRWSRRSGTSAICQVSGSVPGSLLPGVRGQLPGPDQGALSRLSRVTEESGAEVSALRILIDKFVALPLTVDGVNGRLEVKNQQEGAAMATSAPLAFPALSCRGYEIHHAMELGEVALDFAKPVLEQRKVMFRNVMYDKPSLVRSAVTWTAGFHAINGKNGRALPPQEAPGLLLLHLHRADYGTALARHVEYYKKNREGQFDPNQNMDFSFHYRTVDPGPPQALKDGDAYKAFERNKSFFEGFWGRLDSAFSPGISDRAPSWAVWPWGHSTVCASQCSQPQFIDQTWRNEIII